MRKRLYATFAAIALTVGVIAASVRYYNYVSQTIYSESTAHLAEIYHQANQSLRAMVGRNWGSLHMWVPYLQDAEDDEKVKAYIETLREESGFTDFYFISRDGSYRTIDGSSGYLNLKDRLSALAHLSEGIFCLRIRS